VTHEQEDMYATDVQGQKSLAMLVRDACGNPNGCGATTDRFITDAEDRAATAAGADHDQLADETRTVREQAAAASANTGLRPLIYLLPILIFAAAFLGFRARLYEYRYRPR
jgi:hypothetical protein